MSIFNKLVNGIAGMLCLFGCSNDDAQQQRKDLLKWIDFHLAQLAQQVEADIDSEKQGFYPHAGKSGYQSEGSIDYILKEKSGKRLQLPASTLLTLDDIKSTAGYAALSAKINELNLQLVIREQVIDGDEIESYAELDEYIAELEHYFVVTVSGWQASKPLEQQ